MCCCLLAHLFRIGANSAVSDVAVVRRSIRDTDTEKVLNYRYRVTLADGSLVDLTESVFWRPKVFLRSPGTVTIGRMPMAI